MAVVAPHTHHFAYAREDNLRTKIEAQLKEIGRMLPTQTSSPLSHGYRPETDRSSELGGEQQTYYQGFVGILHWICELGRIDILIPWSMLSRYHLVSSRAGHLDPLFHSFAYLKHHTRSTLVFDATDPTTFDEELFKCSDWSSEFYPGAKEAIPLDAPEPRGKTVVTNYSVDSLLYSYSLLYSSRVEAHRCKRLAGQLALSVRYASGLVAPCVRNKIYCTTSLYCRIMELRKIRSDYLASQPRLGFRYMPYLAV